MKTNKAILDHVPIIWYEPEKQVSKNQLVIFLSPLGSSKETSISFLQDLAAKGYTALSFDAWQHGERGNESLEVIVQRVFSNFRRYMWTIIGNTTLDVLHIIDWALATLEVSSEITIAGLSMGGDIAIAAAGIDQRVKRVLAVVTAPDWLRPGMEDVLQPGVILPPGEPDHYAQYFYDTLNPLTHLAEFARAPKMHFICGEKDTHASPNNVFRFQKALQESYPAAAHNIDIKLIPNMKHLDAIMNKNLWWLGCLTILES